MMEGLLAYAESGAGWEIALWVLLGLVTVFFVGAPILVRFTQRCSAEPRIEVLTDESCPLEAREIFHERREALTPLGFQELGRISVTEVAPHVELYCACHRHEHDGTVAAVIIGYLVVGGKRQLHSSHLEFYSRFTNGARVTTTSTRELVWIPREGLRRVLSLPGEDEPVALLEAHRSHLRVEGLTGPALPLKDLDDALDDLQRLFREDFEAMVEAGLFYRDFDGCYRATWGGSFRMTWGQLWPIRPLRLLVRTARARAKLQPLG